MNVLVAMSGGVDSSVAAALLVEQGHDVVGVTLKLWGGASDSGCCSVADVDDARRAAQQLGVEHVVFNFADDFEARVVGPYVRDHARGATPNPCIECNRHLKFDRLLRRAEQLGFDALATGHHARAGRDGAGAWLGRGADRAKDQSYVLHTLDQAALSRVLLPVGELTKDAVRRRAGALGLRTATKPDSQDVCFITSQGGRSAFLGDRIGLHPARVVDTGGRVVGSVAAVELVTLGQRRGLGLPGGTDARYVLDVDVPGGVVTVGAPEELLGDRQPVVGWAWTGAPRPGAVRIQCSAHGRALPARVEEGADGSVSVRWDEPQRRVARGQSLVAYDLADERVLGGGTAG